MGVIEERKALESLQKAAEHGGLDRVYEEKTICKLYYANFIQANNKQECPDKLTPKKYENWFAHMVSKQDELQEQKVVEERNKLEEEKAKPEKGSFFGLYNKRDENLIAAADKRVKQAEKDKKVAMENFKYNEGLRFKEMEEKFPNLGCVKSNPRAFTECCCPESCTNCCDWSMKWPSEIGDYLSIKHRQYTSKHCEKASAV